VILTAVPGAFTPTCQEKHLASYLEDWPKLKAKGIDNVIFISGNDHWVMSAWGKANGVTDNDSIVSLSPRLQATAGVTDGLGTSSLCRMTTYRSVRVWAGLVGRGL
jgi:peroxiredoxin